MKIRSITCFIDPSYPIDGQKLKKAGAFLKVAQPAFVGAGYEVQSTRLATVPFPMLLPDGKPGALARLSSDLESAAGEAGYAYVSMGPAVPERSQSYALIPDALGSTQNTFFSGLVTTHDRKISLASVHQCADVIREAAQISPDGFANLRFGCLANVPPGSPFFPAAYHQGGQATFALATEAADLAVSACTRAATFDEAQSELVHLLEMHATTLTRLAKAVEKQTGVTFGGIDFSLAPFPEADRSIGTAFERFGVPAVGMHGSLAIAAVLADAIDRAQFRRAGFSGLFLPVLEDQVLARRVADGHLGVVDLLLYSAVCGTGLDTIPLPGDTSTGELASVLLDVSALALRLDKPLTARLMPIPGKKAGDPTEFSFGYFANSRVMTLQAAPLDGLLDHSQDISIKPRSGRRGDA